MKKMDAEKEARLLALIADVLEDDWDEAGRAELNTLLGDDPAARQRYREHLEIHARLHLDYAGGGMLPAIPPLSDVAASRTSRTRTARFSRWIPTLAAAALAIFAFVLWISSTANPSVATLLSSENAAWESLLPTTPGAELTSGSLHLKAGVATIRFLSGAEVTLEAPAQLELIDRMRGRLVVGAAVVDVPESAIGFVMETPNSYAIDHGTRFAMAVDASGERSTFEVLTGEISVHDPSSGESQHLFADEASSVSPGGLATVTNPFSERISPGTRPQRISTEGRTKSIIRKPHSGGLDPDFLMVKTGLPDGSQSDRRAFFAFDLTEVDLAPVSSASLRLNLVPTGRGLAGQLPKEIRFQLYGLDSSTDLDWKANWTWEDAPTTAQGRLLGTVEIGRSQQSGSVAWEGPALFEFLNEHRGEVVTFLLIRETKAPANGSLVHGFASDSHPFASGPVLELISTP